MTLANRLSWYAARMRAMSPAEIAWRARTMATSELRRAHGSTVLAGHDGWDLAFRRFQAAEGRPVLLDATRAARIAQRAPEDVAAVVRAADDVLERRFGFFGAEAVEFPGATVDWNLDPRTGHRWPSAPARPIDHRTYPGDAKWIWELNRLQHLPWLAQAWLFTGDRRYADGAFEQLDSWLDQNPVGRGIAWRGAFEAGLRAMSVAVALQGLRTAPGLGLDRYRRVVTLLAASAVMAWQQRSLFSSANNHLLGEMAGVATVAMLHPEIASADRMEARALDVLARESERQFLPDGANAEQATSYQIFAAELLAVPAALIRLRGGIPPAPLLETLRREAAFLRALTADGEPLPRFGDEDGGFALRLVADPTPSLRRHLAVVGALLGEVWADDAGQDLPAAWLAGPSPSGRPPARPAARDLYAPHGGVVVLRRGRLRLTMDVGPLGHLSVAAHGHADALAVTVARDGCDVIGDPGTGTYYAEPSWRPVFRSTRVHATATVDDLDQSVQGGAFLWVRHASVTVRSVDLGAGVVDAEHDGYTRLPQPVVHRRWLVAPPDRTTTLVVDAFTGTGRHRVRTSWPLHPRLDVTSSGLTHHVTEAGEPVMSVVSAATAPLAAWAVRGDESSRLGWWSERFESRVPAWLVGVVTEDNVNIPVAVATLLADGEVDPPTRASVTLAADRIIVKWCEADNSREVSVRLDRPGVVAHRYVSGGS